MSSSSPHNDDEIIHEPDDTSPPPAPCLKSISSDTSEEIEHIIKYFDHPAYDPRQKNVFVHFSEKNFENITDLQVGNVLWYGSLDDLERIVVEEVDYPKGTVAKYTSTSWKYDYEKFAFVCKKIK